MVMDGSKKILKSQLRDTYLPIQGLCNFNESSQQCKVLKAMHRYKGKVSDTNIDDASVQYQRMFVVKIINNLYASYFVNREMNTMFQIRV